MRPLQVATFLILGVSALTADAATLRVPSEYHTLQGALDNAEAGDTVLVAPGTYSEVQTQLFPPWSQAVTSCAFLKDGVTIRSESGPEVTIIDMQQAAGVNPCVLSGYSLSYATVEGFTVTGAALGGRGARLTVNGGATVTLRDCIFRDLDSGTDGSGGGAILASGDLLVETCRFINCNALVGGGALRHAEGRLDMIDCVIRSCGDGAVFTRQLPWGASVSAYVEGCTFEDCWADTHGIAALSVHLGSSHGEAIIRNCEFVGNTTNGGGILDVGGFQQPKLVEGCLLADNFSVPAYGRGTLSLHGDAIVRGNTFFGNSFPADGAVVRFLINGGSWILANNVIEGHGPGSGSAVSAAIGDLTSSCNVFWHITPGYTGSSTDRIVDPLLCDPAAGQFGLTAGSPCLPEGSLGCGLIGAFGEACGVISVNPRSWGQVKALYRDAAAPR